jgi:hypothetical protein
MENYILIIHKDSNKAVMKEELTAEDTEKVVYLINQLIRLRQGRGKNV